MANTKLEEIYEELVLPMLKQRRLDDTIEGRLHMLEEIRRAAEESPVVTHEKWLYWMLISTEINRLRDELKF